MSLRILITNVCLCGPSGTEMYVRDLARGLIRRDHLPVIYSPQLGELADQLRAESIPVVDRLDGIAVAPDVIHGHHSLETMAALLQFPGVPGIFVCHDCSAWHDAAPRFPRLRRYVAVDDACRERLTMAEGVAVNQVVSLTNPVDLGRFRPRGPLPSRPRRGLVFSNYADERTVRPIRAACAAAGIELEVAGLKLGGIQPRPETLLPDFDLVFAKGRCAWEALAVGAAVIVSDATGMGPLVTSEEVENLAAWNFGRRLLRTPLSAAAIAREIARYDSHDAARVSCQVREMADAEVRLSQLIEVYEEVIEQQRQEPTSAQAESQAASDFVHWWAANYRELARHAARERAQRYLSISIAIRLVRSLSKRISRGWKRLEAALKSPRRDLRPSGATAARPVVH